MYKKKSLGQHFLKNPYYLGLVADAADIKQNELVVEIGPGEGTLTEELLKRGAHVVAIEKDSRLIPLLQEKFAGRNFEVIEADALDFEPTYKYYKVVGNIPYYITGALFKKFLEIKNQPSVLVFLIQKEVAERIAREKKESILSLSVKAFGTPAYIKMVPRGAFNPAPNVDSAIIAVSDVSRKHFKNKKHEQKFFELVKKGFGQKRKILASNLGKEYIEVLANAGVAEKARAEELSLKQWVEISKY